jgi:hypothetical protein
MIQVPKNTNSAHMTIVIQNAARRCLSIQSILRDARAKTIVTTVASKPQAKAAPVRGHSVATTLDAIATTTPATKLKAGVPYRLEMSWK